MTHEIAHHGATLGLCELLNGSPNVAHTAARDHLGDAQLERLSGDLGNADSVRARGADVESYRGITMKSLVFVRHIHIDDVALDQLAVGAGDAMADDFID